MAHWQDSSVSNRYSTYRPQYPAELFELVRREVAAAGIDAATATVLDLGCGTGQAMVPLVPMFQRVYGADVSETQVDACNAALDKKVPPEHRSKCSAHVGGASDFGFSGDAADTVVDVVTVAQAMHWFDMPAFANQLDRHLRPGGLVVAWMYSLSELEPAPCDAALRRLDAMLMADGHWPVERKHIDDGYRQLSMRVPYPVESVHTLRPVETRTLDDFVAYLTTWSGVNRYTTATGHKTLLEEWKAEQARHLSGGKDLLRVTLPIRMYVFRRPLLLL